LSYEIFAGLRFTGTSIVNRLGASGQNSPMQVNVSCELQSVFRDVGRSVLAKPTEDPPSLGLCLPKQLTSVCPIEAGNE
jgi:hypothetical protein